MNIVYEQNPDVAYWLTLAVTVLLPLVVAALTKASTAPWIKAVGLLALACLTSIISNLLAVDGAENVGPMIIDALMTFFVAVAAYFGLWRADLAGSLTGLQRIGPHDKAPPAPPAEQQAA